MTVNGTTGAESALTGLGMGWRPPLAEFLADRRDLDFLEVVAESLPTEGPLPAGLAGARAAGLPVVPHGVALSLGGGNANVTIADVDQSNGVIHVTDAVFTPKAS